MPRPLPGDTFTVACDDEAGVFQPAAEVTAEHVTPLTDGTYRIEATRPGSDRPRSLHFTVDTDSHPAGVSLPRPCEHCGTQTFTIDGRPVDAATGLRHPATAEQHA